MLRQRSSHFKSTQDCFGLVFVSFGVGRRVFRVLNKCGLSCSYDRAHGVLRGRKPDLRKLPDDAILVGIWDNLNLHMKVKYEGAERGRVVLYQAHCYSTY
jgi:hypothetical protein